MRLPPAVGTLALCVASLGVGYVLGSRARTITTQREQLAVDAAKRLDGDDDDSETYDGDLSAVEGLGPCKLVLVVRTDLNMSAGKIAAQ
jgi:PTH2 family peptidyl-tRNA hydrolase